MSTLWKWGQKHEGDVLFVLGDMGNIVKLRQLVDKLRYEYGVIVCGLRGNHDLASDTDTFKDIFDEYYTMPQFIHPRVIISHEPIWPCPEGVINLQGHLHGSKLDSNQHICASIHVAQYKPIGWKTIQKAFTKIDKPCYKFLQEPYCRKYIFTQPKDDAVYDKQGHIDYEKSVALYNKNLGKNIPIRKKKKLEW